MVVGNGFGHSKINLLHWPLNGFILLDSSNVIVQIVNVNEFRSIHLLTPISLVILFYSVHDGTILSFSFSEQRQAVFVYFKN